MISEMTFLIRTSVGGRGLQAKAIAAPSRGLRECVGATAAAAHSGEHGAVMAGEAAVND
jgi:hypothetical protein